MDAVLFAGDLEFERCPLAMARPKALWPLDADETLLDRQLDRLAAAGVRRVVVCVNRRADEIRGHLAYRSALGREKPEVIVREDTTPRGPAGCLKDAAAALGTWMEPLIAMEVGSLASVAWADAVDELLVSGAPMSVGVVREADGTLRPAGVYLVTEAALSNIPAKGFQDIKERLLPALAAVGRAAIPMHIAGPVRRLEKPEDYLSAVSEGLSSLRDRGPVMSVTAKVHRRARLVGPVTIGDDAEIGEAALIVGPAVIGRGAKIGKATVIHRTVVWDGATVAGSCHLESCVVTDRAAVPPLSRLKRTVSLAESPGVGGWHVLDIRGYTAEPEAVEDDAVEVDVTFDEPAAIAPAPVTPAKPAAAKTPAAGSDAPPKGYEVSVKSGRADKKPRADRHPAHNPAAGGVPSPQKLLDLWRNGIAQG